MRYVTCDEKRNIKARRMAVGLSETHIYKAIQEKYIKDDSINIMLTTVAVVVMLMASKLS